MLSAAVHRLGPLTSNALPDNKNVVKFYDLRAQIYYYQFSKKCNSFSNPWSSSLPPPEAPTIWPADYFLSAIPPEKCGSFLALIFRLRKCPHCGGNGGPAMAASRHSHNTSTWRPRWHCRLSSCRLALIQRRRRRQRRCKYGQRTR